MSQANKTLDGNMTAKEAQVRYAMSTPVISVNVDATADDAMSAMIDNEISGLPVIDSDGRLVGVITEYDVLRMSRETTSHERPLRSCREVMTKESVTICPDASLHEATAILLKTHFRRLMVVEDDRLIGVLARRDITRFLRDGQDTQDCLPWTPLWYD